MVSWGSGCGSVGRAVASKPEVRNSNPVIGKIYIEHLFTCFLSFLTLKKLSADVLLASG